MIFLDSNILLRYLTQPKDTAAAQMQEQAEALILAAKRGDQLVTLSEVVLHECSYVLASKHQYDLPAKLIADYFTEILNLPGMRLPRGDKRVYLRALGVYRDNPNLGLADSIIAARAERLGASLATFDRALAKLPMVTSVEFD